MLGAGVGPAKAGTPNVAMRGNGSGRGGGKQPIMITIKSTITIRKEGDPLLGAWTRNTVTTRMNIGRF